MPRALAPTLTLLLLSSGAFAQTIQDFDSPGTAYQGANVPGPNAAPAPAAVGPESSDGRYLQLLSPPESGFTRSFGVVGFDQTDPGPCQQITADFDFRITCKLSNREGFNCADGFSFVALNTEVFGTSGAPPALDEAGRSTGRTRSIGIGFVDFFLNGPNRVFLTFNNSIRSTFDIPFEELDLVTGLDAVKGAFHHARIVIESAPEPSVTVELTDGTDGSRVVAFDRFDLSDTVIDGVPFEPYDSRVGFGARTGDAYQWVDLDNVDVTYERCGSGTGTPPTVEDEVAVADASQSPDDPVVENLADGGYVAVWKQLDGDGFGIFARLFDDRGVPIGAARRVNARVAGNQTDPTVTAYADGGFGVAWRDQQGQTVTTPDGRVAMAGITGSSIVARSFSPAGEATTADVEVSGSDDPEPSEPEISADKEGGLVVSWEDRRRVRGRLLRSDGSPRTPVIEIDDGAGDASTPRLATAPNGEFVAVWRTQGGNPLGAGRGAAAATGAGASIVARRFSANGQPSSRTIVVTEDATAEEPAVAIADDGGFVVSWQGADDQGSGTDIFARRFDRDDQPLGAAFTANGERAGRQRRARIDLNAAGDFAVVWESDQALPSAATAGSGPSIVSRFFLPSGQAASDDVEVASTTEGTEPTEPDVTLSDRDRATVTFSRRGPGDSPAGVFATDVVPTLVPDPCRTDAETLCLTDGRFQVRARFEPSSGAGGQARATPLTGDTGYFWFFDESNVELVVKVLDACSFSDRFWVFAGGLTDVFVDLEVTDTETGETQTYANPRGTPFQPIQDTGAFATCDAGDGAAARRPSAVITEHTPSADSVGDALREIDALLASANGGGCATGGDTLCLGGRFAVSVGYRTGSQSGAGNPFQLTADTGYFWFFDESNVELVIKVLDACAFSDRFWVFAGGLTDQGVELQVVDTATGAVVAYENPRGTAFQPIQDTDAFATCP